MSGLITSGGWCAPSETLYDVGYEPAETFTLPNFQVSRDWNPFPEVGSLEYQRQLVKRRAREAVDALIARKIGDIRRAQVTAENWAINYALANGYAVRLHITWGSRFVGVEFIEPDEGTLLVERHDGRTEEWDGV